MFVSGVAMLSSSARIVVVVRCGTARRGTTALGVFFRFSWPGGAKGRGM